MNRDLETGLPIIGSDEQKPAVQNLAILGASVPDLLSEIERQGIDIPATSFALVQSLCQHRNSRWSATTTKGTVEHVDVDMTFPETPSWYVRNKGGDVIAMFVDEFDAHAFNEPDFTDFEKAAEIAGEAGELVNAVKKLRRAQLGMAGNYKPGEGDYAALLGKVHYEVGDVFVTCFNLCERLGLDSWAALRVAFNTKSDEMGFPERL